MILPSTVNNITIIAIVGECNLSIKVTPTKVINYSLTDN